MKIFFKNRKKGELTTEQIVVLIILLASFAILLIYLVFLNPKGETEKQICHNSVVMRGSAVISTEAVPLNCKRDYICLTKDGSCEGMTKPEIKKVKTEDEVYNALAEEMANCWWMFGEGDINYVKDTAIKQNLCSICSQIFFDDSVKEIKTSSGIFPFAKGNISKDVLYEYMTQTKMLDSDKDLTYSQYIFNKDSFDELKQELTSQAGKQVTFGTIEIGKPYFVVMGITTEVNGITWVVGGAAAAGILVVSLATFGIGTAGIFAVAMGETAGGALGLGASHIADLASPEIRGIIVEGEEVDNKFMVPTIIEANSAKFDMLECKEIVSG